MVKHTHGVLRGRRFDSLVCWVLLRQIFFPSAGPSDVGCGKNNRVEREEAWSAKTSSAQTRQKELGPCFFSIFLVQPKKMLRWARTIFFRRKITAIFLCYRNLKNKKAGFKPVQNIMLIPKKILCCNLDAYVNSVSYSDSGAHVNYIAFLSPLWFEHDIKSMMISIFILWCFQRFVTKTGPKLEPVWAICKFMTKIHKSS